MLLPYRPSTFREKALKLLVIGLTSQEDVLRSSSRVPAPPTSAETSGYKRNLNIFSMLSPLVGILQQEGQRNATCMCENSRIHWVGIQESLQTKLDRFLQTHRATPTALGKSPRELLMNGQPRLRFTLLRDKILKQHYVKRKCKEKPKTAFGPIFPDLNKSALLQQTSYTTTRCLPAQS